MKHLKTLIYHLLLEGPHTGYAMAKEVEQRTGWKPSWGSIYPLLESMEAEGSISATQEGRSKVYTLTKTGEKEAHDAVSHSKELIGAVIERMKVFQEFSNEDLSMPIALLTEIQRTGRNPLRPISKNFTPLRNELLRLWQADLLQPNAERINKELSGLTERLRRIR